MPDPANALKRVRDLRYGKVGDLEYKLGTKGINLSGKYGNLQGSGKIGYDGDWNVDLMTQLLGGDLSLNAQNQDGNNRYYLQYLRRF